MTLDNHINSNKASEYTNNTDLSNIKGTLNHYLNRISKIPVFKREEERTIFQEYSICKQLMKTSIENIIKEGREISSLNTQLINKRSKNSIKNITKSIRERKENIVNQKTELDLYTQERERINKYIIEHNLKLVIRPAKYYAPKDKHSEEAILDNIQNGNTGVMAAVDRFDYKKGYKFSTYGVGWIIQKIIRGLQNENYNIRVPVHAYEDYNIIKKIETKFLEKNHRNPTECEITELLIKASKHKKWKQKNRVRDVKNRVESAKQTESLEYKKTQAGDFFGVEDPIEHKLENDYTRKHLEIALSCLPPRNEQIMRSRFGFDDKIPRTLDEVGKIFGVTRERIRQIEQESLINMRNEYRGNLKKYVKTHQNNS